MIEVSVFSTMSTAVPCPIDTKGLKMPLTSIIRINVIRNLTITEISQYFLDTVNKELQIYLQ